MPWYHNPIIVAILGALVGAVTSGLVSVFIWRRTKKIKRVDCIINDVSSLLSISEKIKDQLTVSFAGNPVHTVYLITMDIINTGNEAVKNQPVIIRLAEKSHIIDYSTRTKPLVGFGNLIEIQKKDNSLDLQVELLNPGDMVSLEIVSIDNSSDKVEVYLKNANVQSRVISKGNFYNTLDDFFESNSLMSLAIMSSFPLFRGFAGSIFNFRVAQWISKLNNKK